MPCDSSHLEATSREIESVAVRGFLRDVGVKPVKHPGREEPYYGHPESLDRDTELLCNWCRGHQSLIKKQSLELQLWWRDHQRADARKARDLQAVARAKKLRAQALKKLTPAERRALGI